MNSWQLDQPRELQFEEPVRELDLALIAGDVVVGAGGERSSLEVRRVVGAPLLVTLEGGRLTLKQPREGRSWMDERSASVTVTIPSGCTCHLNTVSASLSLIGLDGEVSASTVSGQVTLDGVEGPAELSSVSGSLAARGMSQEFSGKSVSGEVTLEAFAGAAMTISTVSGDVVADLSGADPAGSAEVRSTSGTVLLRLSAAASQEVRVESVSGQLKSAFQGLQPDRSPGRRRLRGSLGAGEGSVAVKTVSGSVSLLEGSAL